MKSYNLSHWDLDGVVSSIILSREFHFDTVFKGGYHRFNDFIKWVKPNSSVIASDVELGVKQVATLKEKGCDVLLIDHHPRTKETLEMFPDEVIFASDKSGSKLCYELVRNVQKESGKEEDTNIKILMKAANGYDLFLREEEPEWFKLGYDLNLLFWQVNFDQFFARFKDGFNGFKDQEKEFLKKKHSDIKRDLENSEYHDIGVAVKGKICVPVDGSICNDVPHFFGNKHDIYYMINRYKNSGTIAVRSPQKIRLSNYIEEAIGLPGVDSAGGHDDASGVTLAKGVTDEQIVDIINYLHHKIEDGEIPF